MRPRILGMETEYALLFQPESGSLRPTPRKVFDALIRALEGSHITLEALYRKEGRFLSNSAFVHYEAHADAYNHGLVETATPECRTPRDVVTYQRAIDEILAAAGRDAEGLLRSEGWSGKVVIGKNSTDAFGNSYGCHENYRVDDPPGPLRTVLLALGLGLTTLVFVLPFLAVAAVLLLALVGSLLTFVSIVLILRAAAAIPILGLLFRPLERQMQSFLETLHGYLSGLKDEHLAKVTGLFLKYGLFPAITFYSAYLSRMVLRPYRERLTGHLVSRLIYTGCGDVSFRDSETGYRISQRAPHIRRIMKVYWDDLNKPIYDIKQYVFEPLAPFRRNKRLHILFSDSNMAEVSQYLKVATTTLVIDAIESGVDLGPVTLKSPIQAMRDISRFGHAARLKVRGGEEISPVELQRRYLEGVRKSAAPEDHPILELWETILRGIDRNPMSLERELDWVVKKRLLDREVLGGSNWSELSEWGRIFEEARAHHQRGLPYDLEEPATSMAKRIRGRLEERGLDPDRYGEFRDLYYAVMKGDLKYHQIAPERGYLLELERAGLVTRVTDPVAVARAKVDPPEGTRAKARGEIIRWSWNNRERAQVGWRRIAFKGRNLVVRLDDPFSESVDPSVFGDT